MPGPKHEVQQHDLHALGVGLSLKSLPACVQMMILSGWNRLCLGRRLEADDAATALSRGPGVTCAVKWLRSAIQSKRRAAQIL